jgi:hypothetical protein
MKSIFSILAIAFLLIQPAQTTQGVPVVLVENERHPVPALFLYDARAWLENNLPAATNIYAVMNYSLTNRGEFISLAGLSPSTPAPYAWNLEDGNVLWTGSITRVNGAIQLYQPAQKTAALPLPLISVAGPLLDLFPVSNTTGGGVDVFMPWATGKQMMFGDRGVHGGGLGLSGAVGIDWVSGDDFGANAAPAIVYASAAGSVTATCVDDHSQAVLIAGTNSFGYLHLSKNPVIPEGTTFARGAPIGTLVYGSFNDTCGWADQLPKHYHLHWVIQPSAGRFQAEGWTLKTGDATWTRGNEKVTPRKWLTGGGGYGSPASGADDGQTTGTVVIVPGNPNASGGGGAHLWDYVVLFLNDVYSKFVMWYMPSNPINADNDKFWGVAQNMMRDMIETANIFLVNDVINLSPVIFLAGIVLVLQIARFILMQVIVGFSLVRLLRGAVKWW